MAPGGKTYVVELGYGELACGLELARRVLDPSSRALPHVTVRYSKLSLTDSQQHAYTSLCINDLTLGQPFTFDDSNNSEMLKTLLFRCESPTLEAQVYKPDFFQTVSHCTIYDGPPSQLAFRAHASLNHFDWDLSFPAGLRIRPYKAPRLRSLSPGAVKLAVGVWGTQWSSLDLLDTASDDAKIDLLERLFRQLCLGTPRKRASSGRRPLVTRHSSRRIEESLSQPALIRLGDILPEAANRDHNTPKRRAKAGVVVTPPELAAPIVHHLCALRGFSAESLRFGDPAIGAGVFYAHAQRLGVDILSATGVEIDESRAETTAFIYRDLDLRVLTGDFLSMEPERGSWNFVVANPPYLRSQELPPSASRIKTELERSLDLKISGRADLYMYFILAADAWMTDGAVAAWLIPSEFAVTGAGATLRKYLTSNVQLLQLHFFDNDAQRSLFQGVLVAPCVVFLRKSPSRSTDMVRITSGTQVNRPRTSVNIAVEELRTRTRWSTEPPDRSPATHPQLLLGDWFKVRRGIATGANQIFLLSTEDLMAMPHAREFTRPVLTRAHLLPSDGFVSVTVEGMPMAEGVKWLIDSRASLAEIGERSPELRAYLLENMEAAHRAALVRRHRPHFYTQERSSRSEFIFVYMSKLKGLAGNDRFFLNDSDATVLNNFLVLEPLELMKERLEDDDARRQVLRLLREIPEQTLKHHGRVYGGGLVKLEPADLSQVPLPGSASAR